jgi:hypothetical protein
MPNDLIRGFQYGRISPFILMSLFFSNFKPSSTKGTGVAMSFILAMFLFPEIAKRAHEEIVSVTQGQRLPLLSDRPNLPFMEATWKEANRWRAAVPIGTASL